MQAINNHHKFILSHLKRKKTASRVELAKVMGISNQSLTRLTKSLIDLGIIEEQSKKVGARGQPAINLAIRSNRILGAGVVIANNKVTISIDDLNGNNIAIMTRNITLSDTENTLKIATQILQSMIDNLSDEEQLVGIGIAISGFFAANNTICNKFNISGWASVDLTTYFSDKFAVPCILENDGNAAAVGYSLTTAAAHLDSFFLITLSDGIGGGFINSLNLLRGHNGNAGEIAALFSSKKTDVRPSLSSLKLFLDEAKVCDWEECINPLSANHSIYMQWLEQAAASMLQPLNTIQILLDPTAIVLSGELPLVIRQQLAEKLTFNAINYKDVSASKARIMIDDLASPLVKGASALAFYNYLLHT